MKQPEDRPSTFNLASAWVLKPGKALSWLGSPEALKPSLAIYLAYLAVSILFYTLKPLDFPPLPAGAEPEPQRPVIWIGAYALEPVLTALWAILAAYLAWWLKKGSLPLRLFSIVLGAIAPLTLLILFAGTLPRWTLALGLGLFTLALAPGYRKLDPAIWRPLAVLFLSVNALSLALAAPLALTVVLRLEWAYYAVEFLTLFWTLGLITAGLSRLADLSAPRAFCAAFLSILGQLLFVAAIYRLGLLPRGLLKVLLST